MTRTYLLMMGCIAAALSACAAVQRSGPPPGCIKMDCAEVFEGMKPLDASGDEDNDGVRNEIDGAPTIPEDKDGVQDDDGIPDPDVVDAKDDKGDKGEKGAGSGKPSNKVSDLDKDGYADAYDQCMNEAEDRDGFEDNDGCPELDNDGDGTPDATDPCPNIPGTWCTGEKKPPVAATPAPAGSQEKLDIKDELFFGAGSAKLDIVKSKLALRALVLALKEKPDMKIEIRGYTDDRGDAEKNKKLSAARANAVRTYLTKVGVDGARLTAVGLGADDPIASNDTAEGRAKNRRVEFAVIP
ncbi:MAG: OmpA family protein [Deltaproteobacteria bacterium]|nr:OmpA family protein [Deltaproteobacteria bacterium]